MVTYPLVMVSSRFRMMFAANVHAAYCCIVAPFGVLSLPESAKCFAFSVSFL